MKRWDIILIVALVLCAGAGALARLVLAADRTGAVAEIFVAGELTRTLPLSEYGQTVRVDGAAGSLTVSVEANGVAVTEADCPSRDCVRTGWVTRPGECVACLPNQILIKITGDALADPKAPEREVDAVAE